MKKTYHNTFAPFKKDGLPDRDPAAVFILGAGGFIGSALLRECQMRGDQIACLVHQSALRSDSQPSQVHHGSLLTFPWRQLQNDPPEIIYHLARIPGPNGLGRNIAALLSNIANRRLLRWMQQQSNPPRLVLVSGTLGYGSVFEREITEDCPLQPTGFARAYGRGEAPVVTALQGCLPIQVMRPGWVYGEKSWLRSFYVLPMLRDKFVPMYGDGENWMSFIHVEDGAGMIRYFSRLGPAGESFNLFCGESLQQKNFCQLLSGISGLPVRAIALSFKDSAVRESLSFSLRVASKHHELVQNYAYYHPDLQASLSLIYKKLAHEHNRVESGIPE